MSGRFSASSPGGSGSLPLIDVADEAGRTISSGGAVPGNGTALFRPSRLQLPAQNAVAVPVPSNFFDATSGTIGLRMLATNGLTVWRAQRQVALAGKISNIFGMPLLYRPYLSPVIPATLRTGRRYVYEFTAWRDLPLTAASVFGVGINSGPGVVRCVPSIAFTSDVSFYFRNLSTENGGNWTVAYRTAFSASALTLVNTSFSPDVPRAFKMEFLEDWNGAGATLTMSIDGQVVATFNNAQLSPAIVDGNVPWWGFSFGNEGAAAARFDYTTAHRLRVYSVGGDD